MHAFNSKATPNQAKTKGAGRETEEGACVKLAGVRFFNENRVIPVIFGFFETQESQLQ